MKRPFRLFLGGLIGLVALTAWLPDFRLAREIAAARKEGLWTDAGDVRRAIGPVAAEDNAATAIWAAIAKDREVALPPGDLVADVLGGKPVTSAHRDTLAEMEPRLARWRAAAEKPRLDYGHRYELGFRMLFPEFAGVRAAGRSLVASALLGLKPRENLLAAARLSALTRQEPGTVPAVVGLDLGRQALRAAVKLGSAREVERALGPPADVRRVLGPELPAFLDTANREAYLEGLKDLGVKTEPSWGEQLMHSGPFARNTKATAVARWRVLWGRLPKDGTNYGAAAKAVDEEMPKIDALMPSYAEVMEKLLAGKTPGRGGFLRDLGNFEVEREKVRRTYSSK